VLDGRVIFIMSIVCLYVIGILGTVCHQDAPMTGVCDVYDNVTHCTVKIEELRALLSWYDGALGGINCVEPCEYLGDGTLVSESYGRFMACPLGLYGRFFTFEGVGTFQCRDHGGDINVRYGRRYTRNGFVNEWYIVFDLSMQGDNFPYAYDLVNITEVVE